MLRTNILDLCTKSHAKIIYEAIKINLVKASTNTMKFDMTFI
ncbi:unnamed protein product [Brugia timori]|uniref:Uncharacterized protein n=1 Tax=Brugia timori TaxID=42155 RepID=A0A3P7WR62_9BILA|nr:unnamed protein product [Brugia timori]